MALAPLRLFLSYRCLLASVMISVQPTKFNLRGAGFLSAMLLHRVGPAHLLLLLSFLFLVAIAVPAGAADSDWTTQKFTLQQGTLGDDMALVADSAGRISFTVPTNGQLLEENPFLSLSLDGLPPKRAMIYWRTGTADGQLAQVEVAPPVVGTSTYNLGNIRGWEGAVETLGITLQAAPDQPIKVRIVALSSPSLVDTLKVYSYNWSGHRGWLDSDINFITGTRAFNQPPYPVPYFAGLAAVALTLFGLAHLLRRRTRLFNWHIVGCIILCTWIVSDTFWQVRLWQQVSQTWDTFGGKTAGEKLLASEDAALVALARNARQRIPEPDARVFIASSVDVIGMLSAYYMSPLNTYWHRKGPELPTGDVFERGDYILMVRPLQVEYDARAGIVRRPGEAGLKVRQEYGSATGVLLKVI
jgi:hypothetical protein